MAEWLCACGNRNTRKDCPACGARQSRTSSDQGGVGRYCHDGEPLDAQGYCTRGRGFCIEVVSRLKRNGEPDLRSPFACPNCRQYLEWSGACASCHGSQAPEDRGTWAFPGDRYETHDERGHPIGDGHHWVLQAQGPRLACTPEENAAQAKMLARVLGAFDERARVLHV